MLSKELEQCLNGVFHRAREARHEFLTVEHLLLGILETPRVQEVLRACGADLARIQQGLKDNLEQSPRLDKDAERELQPALGFQRVLQRAVFHVTSSGKKEVGVANVLVAVFSEKQSKAVELLNREHVTRLDVVNYVSSGLTRSGRVSPKPSAGGTPLADRPIHLGLGATAQIEPEFAAAADWYAAYAQRHAGDGAEGRLVCMNTYRESWPMWEMHPSGSEVVLCIDGSITLHQERADGSRQSIELGPGHYAINEPGTWHTADIPDSATVVFITSGLGTQHRPR